MSIGRGLSDLESRIGYTFTDSELLQTALTHSSYANERKGRGNAFPSNERLEFLGDAVLEIVVSQYLYDNYKSSAEGALTKMRQYLVCERTLAKIAAEIDLGEYIHLGKGEENTDCRKRPKVLADAMEAVFAAVYLDSRRRGSEDYVSVILSLMSDEIELSAVMQKGDYKTLLQELVEKEGTSILEYSVVDETGPEHDKTFKVVAKVNNNVVGTGSAKSKKNAEMYAARDALSLFGIVV